MVLFAAGLLLLGWITACLGLKLFRILLPVVGFITGLMVGFGGVRDVFGEGAISFSIAIITAVFVGAIMAILSLLFYAVAITIFAMTISATAFTYLGVALGLGDNGFILFLLLATGAIFGLLLATTTQFPTNIVMAVTAFLGVGYILAGIFLLVGDFSVTELRTEGIIHSVMNTVDQSILWLFAWIAGSLIGYNVQMAAKNVDLFNNTYEYKA